MSQHTDYTPHQERTWFLWGWLALLAVYNLFTIASALTGGDNPLAYTIPSDGAPQALTTIVVLAALVATLCAALIALNYRIGYYGMIAAYLVLMIASLLIGFNIGVVLIVGLALFVLGVLLRPLWGRMR